MKNWSSIAQVVYKRTYARNDLGYVENWPQTVARVIAGNLASVDPKFIDEYEGEQLEYFLTNRKAGPAGRGWWFSGAPAHAELGGVALNNCWFLTADKPCHFIMAQDLLMLGGGVGLSCEHRFVTQLPHIKPNVTIKHESTKDADFIVPDSREGWNELTRLVFDSYFTTGRSFSFSSILIRGAGEKICGFGGTSSGPIPLVLCMASISNIFNARAGKHLRPIDAADLVCAIADMVVAGNVRRSAIIILGDPWDKEYLRAKRFDLGSVPSYRCRANFSVVCSDIDDLHPSFWKTYEHGEPFGIVNRQVIQSFGRITERKNDTAIGVNPCAEATLENGEPCNLQEIWLPNLSDENEFFVTSRLMHRWGKRVTMEKYHHELSQQVVAKNRRIGTGITGCLQSKLFTSEVLDNAYLHIQEENKSYSKALGIPTSIRTTVVKPSGTLSLLGDTTPGIHPGYSLYYIRRIRFSSSDPLLDILRQAGYKVEPEKRFDGTFNHDTQIAEFYCDSGKNTPCADQGFSTWDQLNTLLFAQQHWADQAVSCTIYYKKRELPEIRSWLRDNISKIKSISFLPHEDHGFPQAPLEAITKTQFDKSINSVKKINLDSYILGIGELREQLECEGEICPIK